MVCWYVVWKMPTLEEEVLLLAYCWFLFTGSQGICQITYAFKNPKVQKRQMKAPTTQSQP